MVERPPHLRALVAIFRRAGELKESAAIILPNRRQNPIPRFSAAVP